MPLTVDGLFDLETTDYDDLRERFAWTVPERFNVARYTCDRWADGTDRLAIRTDGNGPDYSFADLQARSNQLANHLAATGIEPGDRVGVVMGQTPETVVAHLGIWKLGAVSVPCSILQGVDALRYRFSDSETTYCLGDAHSADTLTQLLDDGSLDGLLLDDEAAAADDRVDTWRALGDHPTAFETHDTASDDDLCLIYTSGTTGEPKGALHAHRFLLGNLPLFALAVSNLDRRDSALYWTPSEWSWVASLFSLVFPALYYGRPVLASGSARFDPERAFRLVERHGITNCLLPATALRRMTDVSAESYDTSSLSVICSGGEAVTEEIVTWVERTFDGVSIHEAYGQTEANSLLGECDRLFEKRRETIGRPMLGHVVRVVDPDDHSRVLAPGETGELALRCGPDPICFTEYLGKPDRTAAKRHDGWLFTEDLAELTDDGYVAFRGRKDDTIISAGYRIHPAEVEAHIADHPAVANVVVAGVPDEDRGEAVTAFVTLVSTDQPPDEVIEEVQRLVREKVAAYAYPRTVQILDEFPTSPSGKIQRSELID